ncbi:MAG: UDP-N-acetylmuramoyl-L-alanine--D-glutamate ligase, partial [Stellaceae bacterium]
LMAWDDSPTRRAVAAAAGLPLVDLGTTKLTGVAALVLSPGIPLHHPTPHPVATAARMAGVPVIGDIELLVEAVPEARFVGITGTNGKSTTTALLAHILKIAGRRVEVGGNLGTAALSLDRLGATGTYVLELSSYQLDLVDRARFDVAVWLNLTPDHLDRHGGIAGYVAAKRRIFRHAGDAGRRRAAIVSVDDAPSRDVADELMRENAWRVTRISVISEETGGVFVKDGYLIDDTGRSAEKVINFSNLPLLPGRHNAQNVAAAYAAARALGLGRDEIAAGVESFPGLAHRQERVRTIGGVAYINDSKATNADAAATALQCYDHVYWIAGGRAKEGGIASLAPFFPRIRHAYLIGEAADQFAATLKGKAPTTQSGTLARALAAAHAAARRDPSGRAVVLLSPACASFDLFADFEARGDAFRTLVAALPEGAA